MKRIRHFGPDKRIPYAASWTSERHDAAIRYDPLVGGLALFQSGKLGDGTPVLGKLHGPRQRECVAKRLCQVCHRHIKGQGVMVADPTMRHIRNIGTRTLVTEPLACRACASVAARHCPGIRRMEQDGTFQCGLVANYDIVVQLLDPNHPDFQGIPGNDGKTPFAGYLRYVPAGWRQLHSVEDLIRLARQ